MLSLGELILAKKDLWIGQYLEPETVQRAGFRNVVSDYFIERKWKWGIEKAWWVKVLPLPYLDMFDELTVCNWLKLTACDWLRLFDFVRFSVCLHTKLSCFLSGNSLYGDSLRPLALCLLNLTIVSFNIVKNIRTLECLNVIPTLWFA